MGEAGRVTLERSRLIRREVRADDRRRYDEVGAGQYFRRDDGNEYVNATDGSGQATELERDGANQRLTDRVVQPSPDEEVIAHDHSVEW